MVVTRGMLGWGSEGTSERRGHSDYENLLKRGILAEGTASAKVLRQGHTRCIGEKERRPVWLEHDEQQGAQWQETKLEIWVGIKLCRIL